MERKEEITGTIVADAPVIVKWFIEEEYSFEADLLRKAYTDGLVDITVPSILKYEVLNALKYGGAFGEDEIKEIALVLDGYEFTEYSIKGTYCLKTIEMAMRKGVTIYDVAYVALAQILDTVLHTADERLIRNVNNPELVKHIRLFRIH